jgi:hypothetical protein
VLLKIVCLLTCRVLSLAVLAFRDDRAKDAELLVLRHENAVLRRHADRARYEAGDRRVRAALRVIQGAESFFRFGERWAAWLRIWRKRPISFRDSEQRH